MENLSSTLKEVPIKDISIGPDNPRKTYEDESMVQLAKSIQEKGILQPVLLRPKGKKYELVCGHRRYRAAKTVGMEKLPANIRELNDDEAFEMMIVENLERKDVHPLEEADAFRKMLDSKKYTVEDIAAKVARSTVYVAQRMELDQLIDDLKKDFIADKINISQAILLARQGKETQKAFREDAYRWDSNGNFGTLSHTRHQLEDENHDLNKAPFNTEDEKLVGGNVGKCSACPKRSGNNPSLFPDVKAKNVCFDVGCYNQKLKAHVLTILDQIEAGEKDYVLLSNFRGVPADLEDWAAKQKLPILKNYDDFRTSSSKKAVKGISLSQDEDFGRILTVEIHAKSKVKAASGSPEEEVNEQLAKIDMRAKRSLELDNEKIEAALRNALAPVEASTEEKNYAQALRNEILNDKTFQGTEDHPNLEQAIMALCLHKAGPYSFGEWIKKELNITHGLWSEAEILKLYNKILKQDQAFFSRALRAFMYYTLTDRQVHDRRSSGYSEALYQWIHLYHPALVNNIQKDQDEVAAARIERTKKRKEKLKSQLQPSKKALEKRFKALQDIGFEYQKSGKVIKEPNYWLGGLAVSVRDIGKISDAEFKKALQEFKKKSEPAEVKS